MRPPRLLLAFFVILIILVVPKSLASLSINEIMYDPPYDDNYNEWVEIYNPSIESVSFENWTLCGVRILQGYVNFADNITYQNDSFEIPPGNFAVLTDNRTQAYDNYNISGIAFHRNSSSLCSGALSSNKTIVLANSSYNFSITINSSLGGLHNSSLCYFNETWQNCIPTPGYENIVKVVNDISPNVTVVSITNATTGNSTFLLDISSDNCSFQSKLSYNMTNETWGSSDVIDNASCGQIVPFTFDNAGNLTLCWNFLNMSECNNIEIFDAVEIEPQPNPPEQCTIQIQIESLSFLNASQSSEYYINISADTCENKDVLIEYWIEDLYGHVVKDSTITNQSITCSRSIKRSWTPDNKAGAYIIFARIVNSSCDSNQAEKLVAIKGESRNDSSISIADYDSSASFGGVLDVELEIYRNDTDKYAIDIWTESNKKSSYVATIHALDKFSYYRMKVPLQIKMNCDGDIDSGNNVLHVSGLGLDIQKTVSIQGYSIQCPSISSGSSSSSSSSGSSSSSSSASLVAAKAPAIDVNFSSPEQAEEGSMLAINVSLSSSFAIQKNVSVYSYIFKGSALASVGGWVPNDVNFVLRPLSNGTIEINNTIKTDAAEGIYFLRVRAKDFAGNKTYDKTAEILIISQNKSKNDTIQIANTATEGDNITVNSSTNNNIAGRAPTGSFSTKSIAATAMATANKPSGNQLGLLILKVWLHAMKK